MPRSAILDQRRLSEAVPARPVETLDDFLNDIHARIAKRAFELFEAHGLYGARELDDWLTAERELFWQPPISVVERNGMLTVEMALPGLKPEDVDVQLTEHKILVRSECERASAGDRSEAQIDELRHGALCRCVELSATLQPAAARATLCDGMLKIEVPVAKEQPATVVPVKESGGRLTA